MGIYDRDYYSRGPSGGGYGGGGGSSGFRFMSFNGWLIIINVAIFILGMVLAQTGRPVAIAENLPPGVPTDRLVMRELPQRGQVPVGRDFPMEVRDRETGRIVGSVRFMSMDPLMEYGHFSTGRAFLGLEVWRFITFQFLHANFLHLFFNMFGLFIFGGLVEQYLGSRRYAAFYLVCGICGALAYLMLNILGNTLNFNFPGFLRGSYLIPLIGASAGVFGVIMASAYVAPNLVVQLIFPPIPLKLKTLAYAYVGIALAGLLLQWRNQGGDAAHVGGAIAGFFFIRNAHLLRDFFDIFGDSRKKGDRPRRPGGGRSRGGLFGGRPAANQADVDRILAKVANHGLQSLTDAEKRTLREATEQQRRG